MLQRRIESSPEIEALLKSVLQMLEADTAILYMYIDEDDLEGTELLDLLSKSQVVQGNKTFYTEVIDNTQFKTKGGLSRLIESYMKGTLDLCNETVRNDLKQLKKYVRVLRFSDLSEREPSKTRWSFDYTRRPPKYLVFQNKILKKRFRTKPIPYEGVTGYFCRVRGVSPIMEDQSVGTSSSRSTKQSSTFSKETNGLNCDGIVWGSNPPCWLCSREEINQSVPHSKFGDDPSVFANYDSHHAAWILLTDKTNNNKVVGCLRLEYYVPTSQHPTTRPRIPSTEFKKRIGPLLKDFAVPQIVDLTVTEIATVRAKQEEQSYSEQYHCLSPILKQLLSIGKKLKWQLNKSKDRFEYDDIRILNDVHYLIEHLFYVLKRNTYYGEAILERINRFIEDLLRTLGLPVSIFGDVWESLRKHEDLMLYSVEDYRDHFMHQFHVFIIGYMIIYSFGIERLRLLLDLLYGSVIHGCLDRSLFSKADVLRIWAFTSLFHDCGYVFEKLPQGFETFSNRALGSSLRSHFFWDQIILGSPEIPEILQKMSRYFIQCDSHGRSFDDIHLFRLLLQQSTMQKDHGVISSIILMQQFSNYSKGHPIVPNIDSIMNIASISIALHNQPVFQNVRQGGSKVCLLKNPFAFILAYCDTAQEWGRKKSVADDERVVIPHLKTIKIPDISMASDLHDNTTRFQNNIFNYSIELDYPATSPGLPPNVSYIEENLKDILDAFVTPSCYDFEIKFSIRDNKSSSFERSFTICGGDCSPHLKR